MSEIDKYAYFHIVAGAGLGMLIADNQHGMTVIVLCLAYRILHGLWQVEG